MLALAVTVLMLRHSSADVSGASGYQVGERIDLPLDWFANEPATTLVFMRSDCAASQTLAARLAELRTRVPLTARMLIVVPQTSEREIEFASTTGADRAEIRTAEFREMKLRVVPAVVTVDAAGVITAESLALDGADGEVALDAFLPSS